MRFKGLDLNLLTALDALLEERSVSRAAERLHLSQPAMSAALGRLRDYFNDPILAMHGKKMIPTPHALALRPMVKELLNGVDVMVSYSTQFDPKTSRRRFRIGASDYLTAVLLPRILPSMQKKAPHITLELVQPSDTMTQMLSQGELDLMISPQENIAPDHPAELLFEERFVVAGWSDNSLFSKRMTKTAFFAAGHVAVEIGVLRPQGFAETQMRALGHERRIELVVSSFLAAPEMLIRTNLLCVMHERLAREYSSRLALTYAELPFEFPVMREMMQYHSTRSSDAGLRWLIQLLKSGVH